MAPAVVCPNPVVLVGCCGCVGCPNPVLLVGAACCCLLSKSSIATFLSKSSSVSRWRSLSKSSIATFLSKSSSVSSESVAVQIQYCYYPLRMRGCCLMVLHSLQQVLEPPLKLKNKGKILIEIGLCTISCAYEATTILI